MKNTAKIMSDQTHMQEYLENIISLMPGHVYWKNIDGVYLGCNELQAKNAGLTSPSEIIGKTDYDLPWKAHADRLREIDNSIVQSGTALTTEELAVLADGTEAIFLSKKVPHYYQGKLVGIVGISFDITEQKRTKRALEETQHKLAGMTLASSNIAHELRTPLASITAGIHSIQEVFPHLIQAYQLAKEANLPVQAFNFPNFNIFNTILNSIELEMKAANSIIDIILMNASPSIETNTAELFSISACIQEALDRYPFRSGQKKLVHFDGDSEKLDFTVKGGRLLMTHVLFNLVKNALYFIMKSDKNTGEANIHIWLEKSQTWNVLHFKDTGTGIPDDILPFIFDRFFSKTHRGAGIGLAFCKMVMESFNGTIECTSVFGDHTHFMLTFPSQVDIVEY